jgi:hypothetical protein
MKHTLLIIGTFLFLTSCQKNQSPTQSAETNYNLNETVKKIINITENRTNELKKIIKNNEYSSNHTNKELNISFSAQNFQQNGFVENEIRNYCNSLIAAEPNFLFNDNFTINTAVSENWDGLPNVFSGNAESLFSHPILTRFDNISQELEVIENNTKYLDKTNFTEEVQQIEAIFQNHSNAVNTDPLLSSSEKEALIDALMAAKSLVKPQMEYFNVLANYIETPNIGIGVQSDTDHEINQSRKRTFFGKLVRAVTRVVLTIAAVTVATAIIVVGAKMIVPASKFAMKVKAKGLSKSIFQGVGKKVTKIHGNGLPNTVYTGKFVTPGSLYFGSIAGVVKSSLKWDSDLSLKKWYKEFDFKTKAKL